MLIFFNHCRFYQLILDNRWTGFWMLVLIFRETLSIGPGDPQNINMESAPEKELWIHPCLKCGACCATYRVSFSKAELERSTTRIAELAADAGGAWAVMPGTDRRHNPSCNYLRGRIGLGAKCGVYEDRPSPCREFKASFEDGRHQAPRCDEARRCHGLNPLTKRDWRP